jgi:hypothetical protein
MLWLTVLIQWWLRILSGDPTAASTFQRLFFFLILIVIVCELVIFFIDVLELLIGTGAIEAS